MSKPKKIIIETDVEDKKGRCGDGYLCQAVATVEYKDKIIKYYLQEQEAQKEEGLLEGSCRSHAFTSIMNSINDTTYNTLEFQKYIETITENTDHKGVLMAKEIDIAIKHFNLDAKAYHSETSEEECAKLIKEALDLGKPVMLFVAHRKAPDLAKNNHALLLLGLDEDDKVIFIDSAGYFRKAKKRSIEELSKCISGPRISDKYFRMIIFNN